MAIHSVPGIGLPLRWQQDNDNEYERIRHQHNPFFHSALDGTEDLYDASSISLQESS